MKEKNQISRGTGIYFAAVILLALVLPVSAGSLASYSYEFSDGLAYGYSVNLSSPSILPVYSATEYSGLNVVHYVAILPGIGQGKSYIPDRGSSDALVRQLVNRYYTNPPKIAATQPPDFITTTPSGSEGVSVATSYDYLDMSNHWVHSSSP